MTKNNTGGLSESMRTALIVDDDEFSADILREILLALGFESIDVAENGRVALQHLARMATTPDLLISDIFMPDMDGIEFLNEISKLKYPGKFALVSGMDIGMLAIARDVATEGGLRLVGSFIKPVSQSMVAQALGLESPAS